MIEFVESPVYSHEIEALLSEDEHRLLQLALLQRPESGDLIRGSGGLRKLRWSVAGSGKRGGLRIIYYVHHKDTIFLLFAYRKNRQEDLTPEQRRFMKRLIEEYTNE